MNNINMEKLMANIDNVYKLVIVASQRVRQLNDGSPRLVETNSEKLMTIALEEIAAGKIGCKEKKGNYLRSQKSGARIQNRG